MNTEQSQDTKQSQNVKKSNLDKFKEFFHAVRIIFDSTKLINEGKYYQITVLYGQLRALLTDKTKERSKELKPLFEIANLLGEDIKIFYMPANLPPSLKEGVFLEVSSLPLSLKKLLSNQEEITLSDYLNVEVVEYKGYKLKAHEIINALSDKYGGSHYDTKVPLYLMELTSFGLNNQPILDNLIIQFADLFTKVGVKLVKKLADFEFFISLYPDNFSIEENFFFDYRLPNSTCRISLFTYQGKLSLLFVDLIGRTISLEVEQILDVNIFYLINITHKITAELYSEIKLNIDGINVLDKLITEPFLMINEIQSYQGYFNRTSERETQEFEFGIGRILMYGKVLEDIDKLNLNISLAQTEIKKMIWFNKNSYGHSAPGNGDIKFEGSVLHKDV